MKTMKSMRKTFPVQLTIAVAAALVACGGGGGGEQAPQLIQLTAANRDVAARAAAASLMMLPLASASAGSVNGPQALAPAEGRWARVSPAHGGFERALGVIPGPTQGCPYGGTMTLSFDDANGNGMLDLGEAAKGVYEECKLAPNQVINGQITTVLEGLSQTTMSARVTLLHLAGESTDGRHGATLNGSMRLTLAQGGETTSQMTLVADGPVTIAVHTHAPYTDTVTLKDGWTQDMSYNAAAGTTTISTDGYAESVAAGGQMRVRTESPLVQRDSEDYPYAGLLGISGANSKLVLTMPSPGQVKLELDDNGDAVVESATTGSWDWLM